MKNLKKKKLIQHYKKHIEHIASHSFTYSLEWIYKFNFHLPKNELLHDKISKHLWDVQYEVCDMFPVKMVVSFAFKLQNKETKELRYYFVSDNKLHHLKSSRNGSSNIRNSIQRIRKKWNELLNPCIIHPSQI